ncbi:uncharacterized protein LOC103524943 [Diaphorina citri]|uniref:Uncharacterized protein LOC103524943 n=1 Tax=Diaphorina citri TaxID=121845 RepID=A0A1S3DWB4_DIACI|nr:uncharacterized protein LOC103524943 [Diaphorina citri]
MVQYRQTICKLEIVGSNPDEYDGSGSGTKSYLRTRSVPKCWIRGQYVGNHRRLNRLAETGELGVLLKGLDEFHVYVPVSYTEAITTTTEFISEFYYDEELVCCCLRQVFGRNDPRYSLIAGFIAGQAYLLLPKHSFLAPTVNNAIQICYGKSQLRAKYLHKVPMAEILHLLSNAFMFHLKVVDKHSCPSMFQNMMRFCSGKASDEIAERFYHFYAQH